jgi:hypothetical protein
MTFTLPKIRVGNPLSCDTLTVFPLFGESSGGGERYVLSDEAIDGEMVSVTEVSEDGSVPDLLVENRGDTRVLFLEGEELIGAKQNRVLNISVLIAAQSRTRVPVSCVEQGRWGYKSRKFGSSRHCSPSSLRYILKKSTHASVKRKRGHCSDQGQVWQEVARKQRSLGTRSPTSALSDSFEALRDKMQQYQESLRPINGAFGMAVALDGKIVSIDLFDSPMTCTKAWDRLLSGLILDALESRTEGQQADTEAAEAALETVSDLPWEQVETVGDGSDFRAVDGTLVASALTLGESLIHASVSVAV